MTAAELAAEIGIDLTTIKPEGRTKLDSFVTEFEANRSKIADAQLQYEEAKREREETLQAIESYGTSAARIAALEANNAAMRASMETLKKAGMAVDIPADDPAAHGRKQPPPVEEQFGGFKRDVNNVISAAFKINREYQEYFGKPYTGDLDEDARQAVARRTDLYTYVATRDNFSGKKQEVEAARLAAQQAEWEAKGVEKYKAEHPNVSEDPMQRGSGDSRASKVLTKRTPDDLRKFTNMSPREKLVASVQRTKQAIASSAA